jgi:hypothetical protein
VESRKISEETGCWDFADPAVVAEVTLKLLGASALTAAAWGAFTARCDDRLADYKFWAAVFVALSQVAEPDRAPGLRDC